MNKIYLTFFLCFLLFSCMEDQRQTKLKTSGSTTGMQVDSSESVKNATINSKEKDLSSEVVKESQDLQKEVISESSEGVTKTEVVQADIVEDSASLQTNSGIDTQNVAPSQTACSQQSQFNVNEVELTYWDITALFLGIIAVLLSIYSIYKSSHQHGVALNKIEDLEQKIQLQINRINFDSQKKKDDISSTIQKRISDLENEIENCKKESNVIQWDFNESHIENNERNESFTKESSRKKGYFGIVKTSGKGIAVFNDYPKSRESAYFDVIYSKDEKSCEFAPISLDRIRSVDVIVNAVDYTGCSMNYAKHMDINKWGEAELDVTSNCWIITKKAKINLKA